jgi:hypothetical protein
MILKLSNTYKYTNNNIDKKILFKVVVGIYNLDIVEREKVCLYSFSETMATLFLCQTQTFTSAKCHLEFCIISAFIMLTVCYILLNQIYE